MSEITCEQAKRDFATLRQIEERLSKKGINFYLHKGQVRFSDETKIIPKAELETIPDVTLLKTICPAVVNEFLGVHKLLKNPDGQYVPEQNFFIDTCNIPDYRTCFEIEPDKSVIEEYFETMKNEGN